MCYSPLFVVKVRCSYHRSVCDSYFLHTGTKRLLLLYMCPIFTRRTTTAHIPFLRFTTVAEQLTLSWKSNIMNKKFLKINNRLWIHLTEVVLLRRCNIYHTSLELINYLLVHWPPLIKNCLYFYINNRISNWVALRPIIIRNFSYSSSYKYILKQNSGNTNKWTSEGSIGFHDFTEKTY